MKSEDLYKAIGNMDDRYIDDRPIAEMHNIQYRPLWRTVVAIAACIALLVFVGTSIWRQNQPFEIVYPSWNGTIQNYYGSLGFYHGASFNYADVASFADTIVVADVMRTFEEQSVVYEDEYRAFAEVKICKVLKGSVWIGKTICVQDTASITDDNVYSLAGGPRMEVGNRVLLFLIAPTIEEKTENDTDYYIQAVPWIGAFFYDSDGRYHPSAEYSDFYIPYKLVDNEPKLLSEIRRLIAKKYRSLNEEDFEMYCRVRGACRENFQI